MDSNFHHPYQPYDIQREFMSNLYQCLEDGKIGIFESPTGTGKSLSLICGSLTWLRDHKRKLFESSDADPQDADGEPDWMADFDRKQRRDQALQRRDDVEARLKKVRDQEDRLKQRMRNGQPAFKRHKATHIPSSEAEDDTQYLLDDYNSDDEANKPVRSQESGPSSFSTETQALMAKLGMPLGPSREEDEVELEDEPKIFYCSRTHSQLTQFAGELRKIKMPPSLAPLSPVVAADNDEPPVELVESVKHLTMGSRKNLCINSAVARLGNAMAINERCLALQDAKTASQHRCRFLPTKETKPLINGFRDHSLADIRDIEDLGALGKRLGVCPYYASRAAVKPSEIVTLPYPLLLQKSTRESLGISLKEHVVIIDEAHNLMDAIAGMYSSTVTLAQMSLAHDQLMAYLQRFRNRLKGKNRVYVAQTVRVIGSITAYLKSFSSEHKFAEVLVKANDILAGKGVDQINLYKLLRYLQESKLARKVDGYTADRTSERNQSVSRSSIAPVLTQVQTFMLALMNPSAEGRFFAQSTLNGTHVELRYVLLDPMNHFREIVEEARAVILAGGTMSPMSDFTQRLFSYLDPGKILTLSCGHVIPSSNLLALPVTRTESGAEFDFTFKGRMDTKMIHDLGKSILSFATAIPDGLVVFFPSYAYLDHCVKTWQAKAANSMSEPLWSTLNATKPIFRETQPRQNEGPKAKDSVPAESLLDAYSSVVSSGNGRGAILLAVINGTLSEGINFSDELGRGVAVVGMPYPNPQSVEWKAKMEFIELQAGSKDASREFATNTCMRAVNQAVGRAIRHKDDYATILLFDRRYGTSAIQEKLPGWIKNSLRPGMGTLDGQQEAEKFFRAKKSAT